jgi:hypothetical protein
MSQIRTVNGKTQKLVFTKFITVKGVRKYHPKGKFFVFWVDIDKAA